MQDSVGTDREGNRITLEDKLPDDSEQLLDIVALKIQVEQLYEALEQLEQREREIIQMRYGLAGGQEVTQREIGDRMQISRSYVSRIEKKALEKLYKRLE
jgi:RNA polymerase sporulation-specific sigma factor